MMLLEQLPASARVCGTLRRLGAKQETAGFFYAACAVQLASAQPQRMVFVTKWLYPDVARQYRTTPSAVERGIRMLIGGIWNAPGELVPIVFPAQNAHPSPREFISGIVSYLAVENTEE